jgi:glycosyltransferase involved in cell wall biosynthesis
MKISCLTITQFKRLDLLRKSIWSYSNQSIDSNLRELILVHHDGHEFTIAIERLLAEFQTSGKIIEVSHLPLGELRNISMANADGDLLCSWDDDDFFHPDRLLIQSRPFEKESCVATTLAKQFFWFPDRHELYIRRGGKEGIHGSMMFRNNLKLKYDTTLKKGEDTKLIETLITQSKENIYCIDDNPHLFVRTYHGLNTWDFEHHFKHTRQALNVEWLLANETKIREWLEVLQISDVDVRDTLQIAFHV